MLQALQPQVNDQQARLEKNSWTAQTRPQSTETESRSTAGCPAPATRRAARCVTSESHDVSGTSSVRPNVKTTAAFFFQAEDGIRAHCVTGVQTCALPI